MIQRAVKRGQRNQHGMSIGMLCADNLNTRNQHLTGLKFRPLNIGIIVSLNGQSDLCLLTNQHLDRVNLCLNA